MTVDKHSVFPELIPKKGYIYEQDHSAVVMCKPKIMPLKSVTLEKIEQKQTKTKETKFVNSVSI